MSDAFRAMVRYMAASSAMELRMTNALPEADAHLSYKDVMCLNLIAEYEGCTATRLADAACVSKPTVTARLNALESKGYIRRVRSDDDGRVQHIELAGPMAVSYGCKWDYLKEVSDALRERFGDERLRDFIEMMDEASRLMTEYDPSVR